MQSTTQPAPTRTNGKICYLEIPAVEVGRSTEFYEKVFGWHIRPEINHVLSRAFRSSYH